MKNIIVTTALILGPIVHAEVDQPRADLGAAFSEVFAHADHPDLEPVLRELWMLGRSLSWYGIEIQQKVGQATVHGALRDALAREVPMTEARARQLTLLFLDIVDQFSLDADRQLARVAAPIIANDKRRHHRRAGAAIGVGATVAAGGFLAGFPLIGMLAVPATGMAGLIFMQGFVTDYDVTSLVKPYLIGCEGMFLAERLHAGESLATIVDQ